VSSQADNLDAWVDDWNTTNTNSTFDGMSGKPDEVPEAPAPNINKPLEDIESNSTVMYNGEKWLFKDSTFNNDTFFTIENWVDYPVEMPKPVKPLKIVTGDEYIQARNTANQVNKRIHSLDPSLRGLQIHEIQPVKFNGNPSDIVNKLYLTPEEHSQLTKWWKNLLDQYSISRRWTGTLSIV
jgi:hypothetical protein